MVVKVDHIGIAVKNLEESLKFYEEILGKAATADIEKGTPLSWELVEK